MSSYDSEKLLARDLLRDPERQYSEDEKRSAIMMQTHFRSSSARKDFGQLCNNGISSDAVEFQRAVKDSKRCPVDGTPAMEEVMASTAAPTGAILAMYSFHKRHKDKCASNFWGMWKCFLNNSIIDLPLAILANFFLVCFAGALFYMPMWASITVRFMFYDGEGQIEIEQFVKWLLVFALCTGTLLVLASIFFTLLQERFGKRIKTQITVVSSDYGKLITRNEVQRFKEGDLAACKSIFFLYFPAGLAAFLLIVAGLNFLFIRSTKLGLVTVGSIAVSSIFCAVYDRFVRDHSQAVEDCEATEREFWTYLHSRDREVAVGEIFALADETAKHSVRQGLYHITMGALFRAFAIMSVVLVTFVGSYQVSGNEMRQYELLFCLFYYMFTMWCVSGLNTCTVGIMRDLGAAFRLTSFVNSTKQYLRDWKNADGDEELEVAQRLAGKSLRMPFVVIVFALSLFAGSVAAFASMASTGKTSIACKPAEMVCNICGHASHIIAMPQYFDMQTGCQFEQTAQQMADSCLATVPNPHTSKGMRALLEARRLGSDDARCDVYVTYHSGQGDDHGYHVPQEEVALPQVNTKITCAAPAACHAEGRVQPSGTCTYPILADMTNCTTMGVEGMCRAGKCMAKSLKGQSKRRMSDKDAEQSWHAQRRLRQLSHVANQKLELTSFERAAMSKIQANKQEQVEQFAEMKRRKLEEQSSSATPASSEHTTCPLPGHENTDDCPGANVHGCMDQNALNFNPHATVNTKCCYPPNRYVKVDMAESVFRENFWTMEVEGHMAGVGLPLIGSDEVCVPQDSCVKVTTYDESCDGMVVGGGGVTVSSRVVVDGTVHTVVDAEGAFECSKRTQFGTCPIEGCTDRLAINFNPAATVDDSTCEYLSCNANERAVVVDLKYDEHPKEISWKLTDESGLSLVDSMEFDHVYAGPKAMHYYCFPETKCLYYLIKDSAGNGMTAKGHYSVKYGDVSNLQTIASGHEFEWIKAHFVGGPATCSKQ